MSQNDNIQNANQMPENAYITWSDDNLADKRIALSEASKSLEEFTGVATAGSYYNRSYKDLAPGPTSGRPGLTKSDYDIFRPEEAVPTKIKDIFRQTDMIYNRVGLVKNVIDLMGDFASQGVRISHPNKKIEKFYRNWFQKVNGQDRSERFLNNLYRLGNIVINRQTAKISVKAEQEMYKANANQQTITYNDITPDNVKREIPWKYTFIDPINVDVIGGSLSSFAGKKVYAIVLPATLRKIINSPKTEAERKIIEQLPSEIVEAAKSKKPFVLDPSKTLVFHYKKDDWKTWAYPMIYSVMDDINTIEKLKLADLAALDGAISNIRIFKLGSLDHKIAPTPAAASKLSSILQNNVGGGTMDLVWGPDIELIESKSNVYQFLGQEKYVPHLNMVYAGLGIPPTLTGTYGAAGTTNNFISLKTLTQRLQYGRRVLLQFWNHEIAMVQKAMGFKQPAIIEFERMDLSNEEAEKALLIQLADRNIISDELLQSTFGIYPELEKSRLNSETKQRNKDQMVTKAGPYFDANFENSMKKIALQLGLATPSQVGLDLPERQPDEMTTVEMKACPPPCANQEPVQDEPSDPITDTNPKNVQLPGRPDGTRDTQQRKQREFKPQPGIPQSASLQLWAIQAQEKISEILNPCLLDFYHKKNMRSLSSEEYNEAESTKTRLFFSLEPNETVDTEIVFSRLDALDSIDMKSRYQRFTQMTKLMSKDLNRQLTADEIRIAKAYFYSQLV